MHSAQEVAIARLRTRLEGRAAEDSVQFRAALEEARALVLRGMSPASAIFRAANAHALDGDAAERMLEVL